MNTQEINTIAMEYAVRISIPGSSAAEVLATAKAFAEFIKS